MPGPQPPVRPDADEEELRAGPGGIPRPVVVGVVACAVVALVVVGVVVLHGRSTPRHHAAAVTSAATTRPAARPAAGPVPSVRCPAAASCSTVLDLPVGTASALRAAVPGAVITSSVSVLANRTGHFEPDLVTRRVEALTGDGTLTLRVDPAPPGTVPSGTRVVRVVRTPTGASAVGQVDGFVVTGAVSGHSPADSAARAADVRALRQLVTTAALTDAQ